MSSSRASGGELGTRYASDAQAPRLTCRQRAEQNGRQVLSACHRTDWPQLGHLTTRTLSLMAWLTDCRR